MGTVARLPVTTPAKALITAAEIDYRPYRWEIKRLRDEHPLFAARLDIPVADFEDAGAFALLPNEDWSENARLARMEYLKGKLAAEEFLRRVDSTRELERYEVDKAEPVGQTIWQKRVAGDISTDPETCHPGQFQCLDLRTPDAKWEIYTADDLRRWEQRGHKSLRGKYGQGQRQDLRWSPLKCPVLLPATQLCAQS